MEHLLFHNSLRRLPFLAKPCACSVRFFRQGSPLRSDERQQRGLDGADGQSPSLAMKGICFLCTAPRCRESKTQTPSKEIP